ncbi:MAG TPA: 3-dehydroquinate synthase [Chloroflexota bacterium]|nr:3-dehydroquinate synthase [Chloroflexota bacterium]
MTSIILTGFMGTGKTTVGREVARRLGLPFVDTDEEVERATGRTVQQLFEEQGEAGFRALERSILRDALARHGTIVATGGGALLAGETRSLLGPRHHVICLTADFATIVQRLNGGSGRPLARSTADLRELLRVRDPVYSRFTQIDTTGRAIEDVASEIVSGFEPATTLKLSVDDRRRSDIVIGVGAADRLSALLGERGLTGQVILVTDTNVAGSGIAARIEGALRASGWNVTLTEIPAGEKYKTLETLNRLYGVALEQWAERGDIVVGIGGGVIGDIAGMLAATYLRGMRLVLVPTSLLAQVDAAIGGKVGVDIQRVKNMVGAFYPADLIVVDPTFLATLPQAEIRNGIAEIVKIAAMRSEELFVQLEEVAASRGEAQRQADRDVAEPSVATQSSPTLPRRGEGAGGEGTHMPPSPISTSIIRQAVQLKVEVVQEDPREKGIRAHLNYGHTIGHGVEAASDYGIAHGEAVSIGMIAESRLAEHAGWASSEAADRIGTLLARLGLPASASALDPADIREAIGHDKKRAAGQIRIAMPEQIGRGTVRAITPAQLDQCIDIALGGGL